MHLPRLAVFALTLIAAGVQAAAAAPDAPSHPRTFMFTYSAALHALPRGHSVRLWLPLPSSDPDQQVSLLSPLPPAAQVAEDPIFHNRILFLQSAPAPDGTLRLSLTFRITRLPVSAHPADARAVSDAAADALYLRPDKRVPVGGKAVKLVGDRPLPRDPMRLARLLYDLVDDHLVYRKDKPGWGNGDSDWACDSRFGNCTDFHSLFISLARWQHLPAKFEIGFLLPDSPGPGKIAGYHCWALFKPAGRSWVPVDISEANQHPALREYYFGHLPPNLRFTTGRDIELVPPQAGPPLNYFIYPYAEVDDKPWPAADVETSFSYRDLPGPSTQP